MGDIILTSSWIPWVNFYGTIDGNNHKIVIPSDLTVSNVYTIDYGENDLTGILRYY